MNCYFIQQLIAHEKKINWFLYYCIFVSASSFTLVDVQTLWLSPQLLKFIGERFYISKRNEAWFSSMLQVGSLTSGFLAAYTSNRYGRQPTLALICLLNIIASILINYGDYMLILFLSRFFCGLAHGITQSVVPVYVSEISHVKHRGVSATCLMIMLGLGTLIANILIPFLTLQRATYLMLIMSISHGFGTHFLSETPHFYVKKGEDQLAEKNLRKLRRNENITFELFHLKEKWRLIPTKISKSARRKTFGIFLLVLCVAQMCLNPATINKTDFKSDRMSYIGIVLVTLIRLISTAISAYFVPKYGCRYVFLITSSACTLYVILHGVYKFLEIQDGEKFIIENKALHHFNEIFYSIMLFFGVISSPYVFASEQFDMHSRETAGLIISTFTSIFGFLWIHIQALLLPYGYYYALIWCFGISLIVLITIGYFVIPERPKQKYFTSSSKSSANESVHSSSMAAGQIDGVHDGILDISFDF